MQTNKGSDRLKFENAVYRYAAAHGVKRGVERLILDALLRKRDFRRNTAWRSKEDLAEDTGYCLNSIKKGLRVLRAKGVIEAVAYEHGGRGMSTIYKFSTIYEKGATNLPPLAPEGEKGASFRPKGGQFSSKRGPETYPPIQYPDIPEAREGAQKDERRAAGRRAAGPHGPLAQREKAAAVADLMREEGCDWATAMRKLQATA